MKNYASKQNKKGKTAYRTPSPFRYKHYKEISSHKTKKK